MLLPIALYFVISLDLGVMNVRKFSGILFMKLLSLLSAILYLDVIIFSQTRSEYLALVLEVILLILAYFFFIRKREDKAEAELQKSAPSLLRKLKSLRRISIAIFILMSIILIVLYNVPSPFNNFGAFTMTDRFSAMASVSSRDERYLSWFSTNLHLEESQTSWSRDRNLSVVRSLRNRRFDRRQAHIQLRLEQLQKGTQRLLPSA